MADTVELSLMPVNREVLYKIPGDGLVFYVKALTGFTIGLFEELDDNWSHLINIGNHIWNITKKKNGNNIQAENNIPNLLSQNEYRRFWLSLSEDGLSIGVDNHTSPVMLLFDPEAHCSKYITFCGQHSEVEHVKVLLPQRIEKPLPIKINKGAVRWVSADNQLPDGSLIGGFEGECLYIIRSKHRGSLTPGKFVPSQGVGFIPWGGVAHEKNEFEVLCGFDCEWVKTKGDKIPIEAVEAGYSEGDNSEKLYVGRAKHEGFLIPGKVQPSHNVCYIPFEESEIAHDEYEILIRPNSNKYAADKYFHTVEIDYESRYNRILMPNGWPIQMEPE